MTYQPVCLPARMNLRIVRGVVFAAIATGVDWRYRCVGLRQIPLMLRRQCQRQLSLPALTADRPCRWMATGTRLSIRILPGLFNILHKENLAGWFMNKKYTPGESALNEYDFSRAGKLKVPGDWNTQRESLLYYEGPVWYERDFDYQPKEHTRVYLHVWRGPL